MKKFTGAPVRQHNRLTRSRLLSLLDVLDEAGTDAGCDDITVTDSALEAHRAERWA